MSGFRIDIPAGGPSRIDLSTLAEQARDETTFNGVIVSPSEHAIIMEALSESDMPDEDVWRWTNAIQYSRIYNEPISQTIQSLDPLNRAFLGKDTAPKTAAKAIEDSFRIRDLTKEQNALGIQLSLTGGMDQTLFERYKEIEVQKQALADNVENRWLTTEILKAGASNYDQIIRSAAMTGAGVVAGALTGGAGAVGVAALFKIGSGSLAASDVYGIEYMNLRMNGADHEVASYTAAITSAAQGVVEVALGADALVASQLSKGAMKSAASAVAKNFILKGGTSVLLRAGAQFGLMTFEEAVEEGLQEVISSIGESAAAHLMKEKGIEIDRKSFDETVSSALESMKGAALAAPLFGLIPGAMGIKADVQTIRGIKQAAADLPKDTFKKVITENEATKGIVEAIPEADREATLDRAWETVQKEEQAKAEKQPESPMYVDGLLHTGEAVMSQRSDGSTDAVIAAANPQTGERYGFVRYDLSPGADRITVTTVKGDRVGPELLLKLAAKYPGIPIEAGSGATTAVQSLIDRMTKSNPRGQEFGAQWFNEGDADENVKVRTELKAQIMGAMPSIDDLHAEMDLELIEANARARGVTLAQYRKDFMQDEFIKLDDDLVQEEFQKRSTTPEYSGLYQEGVKRANAFARIDDMGRTMIVLAKTANFETLVHETGHMFRRVAAGTETGTKLDGYYGVKAGVWTVQQDEQFVDDLLKYLAYGEVPDQSIKGVFKQIAIMLKRVFRVARDQVNPQLKTIMDELFKGNQFAEEAVEQMETPDPAIASRDAIVEPVPEQKEDRVQPAPPSGGAIPVEWVDPASIAVDNDVIEQFKRNTNRKGVGKPLGGKEYRTVPANPLLVWERNDGKRFVASGRHRHDLAMRTGAASIPIQVYKESEGYTIDQMKILDAEQNILDNQGTVQDFAHFFRISGYSEQRAVDNGLLRDERGRMGMVIAQNANESLFALFMMGTIPERKAAAIAEAGKGDNAIQNVGISRFREMEAEKLEIFLQMTRQAVERRAAEDRDEKAQGDLEGFDQDDVYKDMVQQTEKMSDELSKLMYGLVQNRTMLNYTLRLSGPERVKLVEEHNRKAKAEGKPEINIPVGKEGNAAVEEEIAAIEQEIERLNGWQTDRSVMNELRSRAGLPVREEVVESVEEKEVDTETPLMFQPGYHGTPHKVDKFSTKYIGTGEGTQAFGWGMYFAGVKELGQWYAEKTGRNNAKLFIDGKPISDEDYYKMGDIDQIIFRTYHGLPKGSRIKSEMVRELKHDAKGVFKEWKDRYKQAILKMESDAVEVKYEKHLYEVSIPEDGELLDWDKPLDSQNESIRSVIKELGITGEVPHELKLLNPDGAKTGEILYYEIAEKKGGEKNASLYLKSKGVPGIKFLNGVSRGKGEGNYNYVIFDEEDVRITSVLFQPDMFDAQLLNDAAIKTFGVTKNSAEAGFILSDGRMLDFSGKQIGEGTTSDYAGGVKMLEHKAIANVEGVSSREPTINFMKRSGAVMVDFMAGSAYSIGLPSFDAAAVLSAHATGKFMLHVDGPDGKLVGRKMLQNATPLEVARFYASPTKPETASLFDDADMPAPREKNGQLMLFQASPPPGSETFRSWFADSKATYQDGTPRPFYHGTTRVFDRFDPELQGSKTDFGWLGAGFYFSSSTDTANRYSRPGYDRDAIPNVIPVYLSIQNPYYYGIKNRGLNDELYGDQALPANIRDAVLKEAKQNNWYENIQSYTQGAVLANAMTDVLRRMGYDGVIAEDADGFEVVVFDSNQAKSIYNQNPTSDPRLMFQAEPPLADGMVRLYRGETSSGEFVSPPEWMLENEEVKASIKASGRWFNASPELAEYYVNTFGSKDGRITYVDIPEADIEKYRASNLPEGKYSAPGRASEEFYLPKELADARKQLSVDEGFTLFQPDNGSLVVLHNINADMIATIDNFGGLPMPSIAVTRPDIPFLGFGDSTLIAKPEVAREALKSGRLFDRDIWSPTVPRPEWKVDKKILGKYEKIIDDASRKVGRRFSIESMGWSGLDGPSDAKNKLSLEIGSRIAFLESAGVPVEISMKPVDGPSGVPIGVVAAVKEHIKNDGTFDYNGYDTRMEQIESLKEVIKAAALKEKDMKEVLKRDVELLDSIVEQWTSFHYGSAIIDAALVYEPGKTEVSYYETKDRIDEAIKARQDEYDKWVADMVQPAYSNPTIKVGGKKEPFNADTVLRWMKGQGTKASQETMTYGPNKAAARASREFMSREQIASVEGGLVAQERHQKYWSENIEPLTKELQEKLPGFYKYDDTWEALDTIYKAIGSYLNVSTAMSPERMKKALSAHGFTNVPKELVNTATEVAGLMVNIPQDYFEAKPKRIVRLAEFEAAVIPASTNQDTKDAIKQTGLEVHEYEGDGQRAEIVRMIAASKTEILFQPSIEETSTSIQDELYIRGIQYSVQFSRSSLSRYYRFDYNDRNYTVRISDHKAPPSRYYGTIDFNIDVRSPADMDRFMRWLEDEVGVLYPGKGMTEPAVMFSAEDEPEPPMKEFNENRGKFTAMMNEEGKVEEFLKALWGRMKEDYDASDDPNPKSETEYKLSSHPFVAGAAVAIGKNGKTLNPSVRRAVLGVIRKNEVAFKEMYADIMGDMEMSRQARAERASVVGPEPVKTPRLKGYQPMTLAERQAIVDRVRDKAVQEKIENDSITDAEIVEYIGRLESDRAKLAAKERSLESERDRKKGYVDALKSAREEAAMQTRRVVMEIRAMNKLRETRARIMKQIMAPPGKDVNYEQKQKIRFIQAYLRTKRWETVRTEAGGYKKTGNITQPRYDELLKSGLFRETPGLENILAGFIVERINSKPVSDWSAAELEEMNREIDSLRKEGLAITAMKRAKRRTLYETTRLAIERVMKTSPEYRKPLASQSEEEREQLRTLNNKHTVTFAGINMRRFAAYYLDKGNAEKTNYNLLVEEELDHFRDKMKNYDRRTKVVNDYMKKNGIKPKDLYRKLTVNVEGNPVTYTASDLMMIQLAVRNEFSREAFIFGNLFTNDERKGFESLDKDEVKAMGEKRLRPFMEAIERELTQDEKTIGELIAADFDKEYDRLNDAVIELTNDDMKRENNYVPIRRTGVEFTTATEETINDLYARMGVMMKASPDSGFTKQRIKMGPAHQTAIKLDLFATYLDAVEKQEHLINYGEYHRKLIGVYGDRIMGAGTIREAILHRWGPGAIKYLEQYIAEVANPIQYKDRAYSETLIRKFRGNLAVGYLAYRWSSVLNQIITSPLPFLAYAPGHMAGAAAEAIQNPARWIEEVEGLSAVLKHRQFDVMYELVKHQAPEGYAKLVKEIGQKGMEGLRFADRWTVAIGWKAVYNSEYQKSHNVETAVKKADEVTLKCQPSARGVDLSPLFRDNSEALRAFTMFGSQLNVVWQQASQDVPNAMAEGRYSEGVGIIVGMVLAGIGMGAVRKLRKKDDDDGWKDWAYYSISQPLESAPLIGSLLSGAARNVITGDRVWSSGDGMMPVAEEIIGGTTRLLKGDLKGLAQAAEGAGLALGMPTLAVQEYLGWAIDLLEDE